MMKAIFSTARLVLKLPRRRQYSICINSDEYDESDDIEALKEPKSEKQSPSCSSQNKESSIKVETKDSTEKTISNEKIRVMDNISKFVWEDYGYFWKPSAPEVIIENIRIFVETHGELPKVQGSRQNESELGAEVEKQMLAYRLVKNDGHLKPLTQLQKDHLSPKTVLLQDPPYEDMAKSLLEPESDPQDDINME